MKSELCLHRTGSVVNEYFLFEFKYKDTGLTWICVWKEFISIEIEMTV